MSKRLTTVLTLLLLLGVLAVFGAKRVGGHHDGRPQGPVPMTSEDGRTYTVEPGKTLGSAMEQGAVYSAAPQDEAGACVPEPMKDKPEGATGCRCYEITECKGSEARECKRHCRKDLCQCCDL